MAGGRNIVLRTTKGSELTWQEGDNNVDSLDTDLTTAEESIETLQTDVAAKANITSPALAGVPTAPTATAGTDNSQIATTEFVNAAVAAGAGRDSPGRHSRRLAARQAAAATVRQDGGVCRRGRKSETRRDRLSIPPGDRQGLGPLTPDSRL